MGNTNGTGLVVAFASDKMGRGEDELGDVLIRNFIHVLCEQEERPEKILFYNTGVKLAAKDSAVVEDLRKLADAGSELLVCGTCANYFNLSGKIGVGSISNMYVIAETMCGAARLVSP